MEIRGQQTEVQPIGAGLVDISIIIATRNRGEWLPTALTHLEQQIFPAARFEVVVADCGSQDDTVSIVQRFASGSPIRIRITQIDSHLRAAGRNRAAAESEGRLLLFLADDELASPRLLKNHAEAQQRRDERGCVHGDVHPHPQLPPQSLTRLMLHEGEGHGESGLPYYVDAQESNYSISRRIFDSFGGFTEDPDLESVEHIELAYRLFQDSVEYNAIEDARSYVWQPARFSEERERHYTAGYSLYYLLRITHSKSLFQRYRLRRSQPEKLFSRIVMPWYIRACRRQEDENLLFAGTLFRRILRHERASGFDDARQSRPRRPPAPQESAFSGTPTPSAENSY